MGTKQEATLKAYEPWVVTVRADMVDCINTTEVFRGTKTECLRIAHAFGGWGEDDSRRNAGPWQVQTGRVKDWEAFLDGWPF